MGLIIWGGLIPACLFTAWAVLRHPVRQFAEELHLENARTQFRQQREWLEARFVSALGRVDPIERLRWEDAHWHNEIVWARDRKSRTLLALIGVHFDDPLEHAIADATQRHATALFEFRKGRWFADGKRLDELRPDEAMLRSPRFEPVVSHPPRRGF